MKHLNLSAYVQNARASLWFRDQMQLISIALMGAGILLVWLGPTLSGWGAINEPWCLSTSADLNDQLAGMFWHATHHCPYCYLGIASIFVGSMLFVSRMRQGHDS